MTGEQSRLLKVGDIVRWQKDQADLGTVIETNWAGLTVKWDNRSQQTIQTTWRRWSGRRKRRNAVRLNDASVKFKSAKSGKGVGVRLREGSD
jgi:hypothetical protein